jgi:hypothetical protein
MAKELFKPSYAPPGWKYGDAKAAGTLRESETWWIRLRHHGKTIRESSKTTKYDEARSFLARKKASLARGEPFVPKADHVTFGEMAKRLREDYTINGKHLPTLEARLARLEPAFGARRMADLRPDDVATYIARRHAVLATNGTINRELQVLARAFALGRKLGLLTVALPIRNHRLTEAAPRQGFFERAQYEAVLQNLTRRVPKAMEPAHDLRLARTLAYRFGWRMQPEILMLELRHVQLDAAEYGTLSLDPGGTKNEDARMVCLTPEVQAVVAAQLARLDAFQTATGIVTPYLSVHLERPTSWPTHQGVQARMGDGVPASRARVGGGRW